MITELHPFRADYLTNPSQAALRELAKDQVPAILETAAGNLDKVARNKARMARYTYIIAAESDASLYSHGVLPREQAQPLIDAQHAYIEERGQLIEVQGWVGIGPRAVPVQWLYTLEGANIAGMQQVLAFPREEVENGCSALPFRPRFRVVYTPDFCPDVPGGQRILVDLVNYVTYIMGPDYFGESKKAALRMLNHLVYQQGGLTLHAGAKEVHLGDGRRVSMTIMGLSGTGKTTTTFSKQGELTRPIQDDMVCLWPGGELSVTENGCFAKTFGLTEETEPIIYRGTLSPEAWVENVYTDERGWYDFSKSLLDSSEVARMREVLLQTGSDSAKVDAYICGSVQVADILDETGTPADGWDFVKWTENGRSIIPMSSIDGAADLSRVGAVEYMGILNRDEGQDACTPGIVKFDDPRQAAGFFMLGETTKTSAAGKDRGKTRSPFTQPFFPLAHGLQAKRFSELAATMPEVGLWMMNTGYVGGDSSSVKQGEGYKVKIRHSSAMLEALLADRIVWTRDPDFGYLVVDVDHPDNAALLDKVPVAILSPRRHYEETGRLAVYERWVRDMNQARAAFLRSYDVDEAIVEATVND